MHGWGSGKKKLAEEGQEQRERGRDRELRKKATGERTRERIEGRTGKEDDSHGGSGEVWGLSLIHISEPTRPKR